MYYCDNLIQNYSYTIIKEAYHSVPRAALGLSDHCLVHLIPTYRQKLKAAKPVTRTGKSSYKAVILSQKKEAQRLKCLSKKLLDLSSSLFWERVIRGSEKLINLATNSLSLHPWRRHKISAFWLVRSPVNEAPCERSNDEILVMVRSRRHLHNSWHQRWRPYNTNFHKQGWCYKRSLPGLPAKMIYLTKLHQQTDHPSFPQTAISLVTGLP